MPAPIPMSEAVDETAAKLFGSLEEPLKTKCRYLYARHKIEAMQDRGDAPSAELLARYEELEDTLEEMGLDPNQIEYRLASSAPSS